MCALSSCRGECKSLYYACFVAFLAGLILSADHLGGRGGPKDIASRAPVQVAVAGHLSDARCGPDEQQASLASDPAIALRGLEKQEYRMVIEISLRLCLRLARTRHLTPAKNRYARFRAKVQPRARLAPTLA